MLVSPNRGGAILLSLGTPKGTLVLGNPYMLLKKMFFGSQLWKEALQGQAFKFKIEVNTGDEASLM